MSGPLVADAAVLGAGVALAARGVTKLFPGVVANDRVDFEVAPGEVHALLGENGSGKTTLCKMLTGMYRPDGGEILVGGRPVEFHSPADAYAAGMFMVHQHFSLVDRMSVAENVVLGWSRNIGVHFNRKAVELEVQAAADGFGIHVDPRAPIWRLSVGERQKVEILKALCRGARTLILDEPTTVLTPQEVEQLFSLLRGMVKNGGSVVFISHKLHEVLTVCDRVTILRQGRTTGQLDLSGNESIDTHELARMMVGREVRLTKREAVFLPADVEPALTVDDLLVHNDFGRPIVKNVSLHVAPGEIVGIAGVAGNGQRELVEAICGLRAHDSGTVVVNGQRLKSGDPAEATARGIAFVPEERMGVGLAPGLTVAENLVLKAVQTRDFRNGPFIRGGQVQRCAKDLIERFDVRGTPGTLVRQLSGGNAQKVLLAREMTSDPTVLVIAAPTRGLDVSAMESVRRLLAEAARSQVAVLMVSEDLDEILDLADRIVVICDGRIAGERNAADADREEIGVLMMGQEDDQ